MSTIIESLEDMAKKESKVRAVLKRSLSFDPGTYPPVFSYVESRLSDEDSNWKRTVYYLVAGLWAQHWWEGRGAGEDLPVACEALYAKESHSPSIEKRFVSLLDADEGQLAYRLRQMVSLLKDYPIDFDALLKDLLSWNHPDKFVQIKWARSFYRTESATDSKPDTHSTKEDPQ